MKKLVLGGIEYVEIPEPKKLKPGETYCSVCAFGEKPFQCSHAIDLSPSIFGGDCMERDVIYKKVESA